MEKEKVNINREALLSIIKTSNLVMKIADRFFANHILTDVQFNILMILKQAPKEGISQQGISEQLVVTKSNVVGLLDRMERSGLVERRPHPTDRRYHRVVLTATGRKILEKVEAEYLAEVDRIMSPLNESEKKTVISATEKIRGFLMEPQQERKKQ